MSSTFNDNPFGILGLSATERCLAVETEVNSQRALRQSAFFSLDQSKYQGGRLNAMLMDAKTISDYFIDGTLPEYRPAGPVSL